MFYMVGAGLEYEDVHNRVNLTVVRQSKDQVYSQSLSGNHH